MTLWARTPQRFAAEAFFSNAELLRLIRSGLRRLPGLRRHGSGLLLGRRSRRRRDILRHVVGLRYLRGLTIAGHRRSRSSRRGRAEGPEPNRSWWHGRPPSSAARSARPPPRSRLYRPWPCVPPSPACRRSHRARRFRWPAPWQPERLHKAIWLSCPRWRADWRPCPGPVSPSAASQPEVTSERSGAVHSRRRRMRAPSSRPVSSR